MGKDTIWYVGGSKVRSVGLLVTTYVAGGVDDTNVVTPIMHVPDLHATRRADAGEMGG